MEISENVSKLYNQIIKDPNLVTNKQKGVAKTASNHYIVPSVDGNRLHQAVWGVNQAATPLQAVAPQVEGAANHSTQLSKWLGSQGVGEDLVKKLMRLSDDFAMQDKAGAKIYGLKGDVPSPGFESIRSPDHTGRVNLGDVDQIGSLDNKGLLNIEKDQSI